MPGAEAAAARPRVEALAARRLRAQAPHAHRVVELKERGGSMDATRMMMGMTMMSSGVMPMPWRLWLVRRRGRWMEGRWEGRRWRL